MSGRERERERERERDRRAAAQARTNEYFVPKDGIDREVITADICRYLGNDALVRPGNYENPTTRQVQQGYFITAYRNLTTAMIADLKADSERWEQERRAASAQRGPTVEYRSSTTHQSRQYYGPSTETVPQGAGYATTPTTQVYDNGQYQQQAFAQPTANYAQSSGYTPDNYYVAGGDMQVDRSQPRMPVSQADPAVPRGSNVQYSVQAPTVYAQQPSSSYYAPSGVATASAHYSSQATDPYYGRAVPVATTYDSQDPYGDQTYRDPSYNQASGMAPPTTNPTATSRRDREREERDRHNAHRRTGR